MISLQLVWLSSLSLAASAMMVFAIIVIRRFWSERTDKHEAIIRKTVQGLLFQYIDADAASASGYMVTLMSLNKFERRLLRQTGVNLSNLIQGRERDQIATLLGRIGFRESCIEELHDKEIRHRLAAIGALQLFPDIESKKALLSLLDDPDESVRIAAADSLNKIGALPKPNILVAKLSTDTILQSRDLRSLFRDIARQAPSYLCSIAKFNRINRLMKIAVADAMSEAADFSVLQDLFKYSTDSDLDLRSTAIRSLGVLQHPSAEPYLATAIDADQWQVRAVSAQAIGLIGLESLIQKLRPLLDDDNWWVRFRSAEALASLGPTGLQELSARAGIVLSINDNAGGRTAALLLDEQSITNMPKVKTHA